MPSSISSPVSSDLALEVRSLTGPKASPIIHDIDLEVSTRGRTLVLGPMQSGKSMLMRHLVGLECAATGLMIVGDLTHDPTRSDEAALRRLRARVGVIFEGSALLRRISVLENVELPLLEHRHVSRGSARDAARELLAEVGMFVEDDTMPAQLGRAEQRRVALARAVALRPGLVLLDEPTLGLDGVAAHEFDDTLRMLQEEYEFGIVIFSHEVRHAFAPMNEIVVMASGRIVARGSREALLESEDPLIHRMFHRRERE